MNGGNFFVSQTISRRQYKEAFMVRGRTDSNLFVSGKQARSVRRLPNREPETNRLQ